MNLEALAPIFHVQISTHHSSNELTTTFTSIAIVICKPLQTNATAPGVDQHYALVCESSMERSKRASFCVCVCVSPGISVPTSDSSTVTLDENAAIYHRHDLKHLDSHFH